MPGIADRLHQPAVGCGIVGQSLDAPAGRVDGDVLEGAVERAGAKQLERPPDAVAHAHEVGALAQQVLVDLRRDVGIGRNELQPAA